jgi:hypothetical protein
MSKKVLWIAILKHNNPDGIVALCFVEEVA